MTRMVLTATTYLRWCREVGEKATRLLAIELDYSLEEIEAWENELKGK